MLDTVLVAGDDAAADPTVIDRLVVVVDQAGFALLKDCMGSRGTGCSSRNCYN